MNALPQYDPRHGCNRWVACFDLLGIRHLISEGEHLDVFHAYANAQRQARQSGFDEIHPVWFSDTFVLYTDDASVSDFTAIHSTCGWFMRSLTEKLTPVRGALACGDLYADKENGIFFGKALIESYRYGDSQDWIGFVLAPSAAARLREVGLPPEERLDYARWRVPFKRDARIPDEVLFACLFAGATDLPLRKSLMDRLLEMKRLAEADTSREERERQGIVSKYRRTLEFLDQNLRVRLNTAGNS